jgi:uncharacterized membrane protein YkvA (DUF1232 family)
MPLRVTFTLSDQDLKYFRQRVRESRLRAQGTAPEEIIGGARDLLERVRAVEVPEFLAERIGKLETLISMVDDELWKVQEDVRRRVLSALAYFVNPYDIIPDDVPGIGFLDDAIIVELIVRELKHDIEAYEDFVRFDRERRRTARGDARTTDPDQYKAARQRLLRRARRRSRRERDRVGRSIRLF